MAVRLDTAIQFLKGVGPKLGGLLRAKGVHTVQDLLEWYPRAYEDRRAARNIASLEPNETVSLKAQFVKVASFAMGRSKRKIYDVTVGDASGKIHCKYFRVPYKGYFERFKPGQTVRVIGKVIFYRNQIEFHHPDIQDDNPEEEIEDLLAPIYPETEGVTTRQLRKLIQTALAELAEQNREEIKAESLLEKSGKPAPRLNRYGGEVRAGDIDEAPPRIERLPRWIRESNQLPGRYEALLALHQPPKDAGDVWMQSKSPSHQRIIFEEFFWLELFLAARRAGLQREAGIVLKPDLVLVQKLEKSLPFALTGAQKRSLQEIVKDMAAGSPMHRLVQGDVGSGKTLVALMSALVAIQNKMQVAIMVPTEILAEQHFLNAKKFLEPLGVTVGCLTGSMRAAERKQTLELVRSGAIQICVGTHALIQEDVEFKRLALAIIDEQHRFGVEQRGLLKAKGASPHFLIMTATPIPRTLAMTVYGDLEVSVIDELPPGRTPIKTRIAYESARPKVMSFLREQLVSGRQAYIVYPLVEESEKIDLKDALSNFERLKLEFSDYKLGLLHGKMKPAEKDDVMRAFRAGELQILVATTVIEVGVDVPNANIMIIEHAERFGLSQLHQLRGRVGRGAAKSFCVLMMGYAVSEEARERTQIMEQTSDGFKIAEADLEIRGPGEFMGRRQSGLAGFKLANLVRDIAILQRAREAAFEVLSRDPTLTRAEHLALREELLRAHGPAALAGIG